MGDRSPCDHMFSANLTDFFTDSNVGLAVFDDRLRYQAINPFLAEMHALSVESHFGKTVREILGEVAFRAEPAIRRVFQTGQAISNYEVAGRFPARTETGRWVMNLVPIKESNRRVRQAGAVVVPMPSDTTLQVNSHKETATATKET